jgi:hypothetical protein
MVKVIAQNIEQERNQIQGGQRLISFISNLHVGVRFHRDNSTDYTEAPSSSEANSSSPSSCRKADTSSSPSSCRKADTSAASSGREADTSSSAIAPTGQDATGQDAAGQDATGKDATGQDTTGKGTTGQDATGKDAAGQDATGKGTTGSKADHSHWPCHIYKVCVRRKVSARNS